MTEICAINGTSQTYPVSSKGKKLQNAQKVDIPEVQDTFEKQPQVVVIKKTGGGWKGVISAFVPGLGQLADGRLGAAAGYFFGTSALSTATYIGSVLASAKNPKLGIATALVGGLATLGLWVSNIVDAVKGRKCKEEI